MFNIFNSNVFIEIGEAIGNVKDRVLGKRGSTDAVEQAFRKWLTDSPRPRLPFVEGGLAYPDDTTVEGSFHILVDGKEEG